MWTQEKARLHAQAAFVDGKSWSDEQQELRSAGCPFQYIHAASLAYQGCVSNLMAWQPDNAWIN